jgi:hypothetical protein
MREKNAGTEGEQNSVTQQSYEDRHGSNVVLARQVQKLVKNWSSKFYLLINVAIVR